MPADLDDWDELPSVMSVDAETARQSLISYDDFMVPPPPAQPMAQEKEASFLHVWDQSYCDSETFRNSMESVDVFLE
ncbi:hypothetical protein COHA_003781 [Chlorella ohadii]|uniref:Uncharacterized protein n=1 Tax=Chlorella ohadii TaxID=2649997 RepID=A0AAD5DUA7_9CHLO|nr:hypothetical protein COHA_003781 [Chlorella ohadii]